MDEKAELNEIINVYYQSWFKINDIYHVWAREHGIHETALFVLYVINEASSYCTQNEICDKLFLPKQTVSLILSSFEKKRYILREADPKDRRNKIVRFTEQGSQYANGILGELKSAEMAAFSNMSELQRKAMIENFCILSDLLGKSLSK